ncbi:M20 family metallopeptidase [Mongoliibacter ruber]|uniref:Acetylornithine deacetylase/succinyl-diaminopimelate desuccinylase-like protein n=1 Tax=Mongoliibacter ruber TaxID=1750599 RepID=A0A2T0WFU8_9BACT|nr:M20/M25/M40 family metallo-hydrolase [Mongoliibacter ruber]PRY85545.1 acetylornithine deacetylase/succinyl-diaminopimelate desuccinylase-like protein [Mongoliibacter ruber]
MNLTFKKFLFLLSIAVSLSFQAILGQTISLSSSQKSAVEFLDAQAQRAAQMLVEVGGIISPSGKEQERANKVAEYMRGIGLSDVHVDNLPNAIGTIPGKSDKVLVFVSTLDDLETVAMHQKESGKAPFIEGERVIGPGTNTSSITVSMLLAAEAVIKSGQQPSHTLVFAAVAQEETGLKGMHSVYETFKDQSIGFVDILGDGRSISYGAMGIHWYKVKAFGPPGHSLRGGLPNVNQGMAKAIDRIFQLDYKEDRTVVNIAMIESGKVFNHKPEEGWFSLDMRSLNNNTLQEMEAKVKQILKEVGEETQVELQLEPFQITPGGQIEGAPESPLVKRAEGISKYLGHDPNMSNAGSSNMNIAIAGGSPAIGLGGERGGQRGFPDEWASIPSMIGAAKHVYLLASFDW